LRKVLATIDDVIGAWRVAPPDVWLLMEPRAQAIEMADAPGNIPMPGRRPHDSIRGQALLSQRLAERGLTGVVARIKDMPENPLGRVAFASHLVAWEADEARRLLDWSNAGGTLVIDATCGRKTFDAVQYRRWPGHFAESIGLAVGGHESRAEHYDIEVNGHPAGRWPLARLSASLDAEAGWTAWCNVRFAIDGEPAVWERDWGSWRIVIIRGVVGPSLIEWPEEDEAIRTILDGVTVGLKPTLWPIPGQRGTTLHPVATDRGQLFVVLAPEIPQGGRRPIRLKGPPHAVWRDFWSDESTPADAAGEISLMAHDGVALLWRDG